MKIQKSFQEIREQCGCQSWCGIGPCDCDRAWKSGKYDLELFCDNKRHLVCKPFSIENLHRMAEFLEIDKCFFEYSNKGRLPHYDIPKGRIKEIQSKCKVVNFRDIVKIIKGE